MRRHHEGCSVLDIAATSGNVRAVKALAKK